MASSVEKVAGALERLQGGRTSSEGDQWVEKCAKHAQWLLPFARPTSSPCSRVKLEARSPLQAGPMTW